MGATKKKTLCVPCFLSSSRLKMSHSLNHKQHGAARKRGMKHVDSPGCLLTCFQTDSNRPLPHLKKKPSSSWIPISGLWLVRPSQVRGHPVLCFSPVQPLSCKAREKQKLSLSTQWANSVCMSYKIISFIIRTDHINNVCLPFSDRNSYLKKNNQRFLHSFKKCILFLTSLWDTSKTGLINSAPEKESVNSAVNISLCPKRVKSSKEEQQKFIISIHNQNQPLAFVLPVASVQAFPGFCLFLRASRVLTKLRFSQREKPWLMSSAYINPPGTAGRLRQGI